MAWNGLGQYNLNPAFTPEVNGTVIDAVRYNGNTSDIAAGITACLAKNGENVPTANLPMAGYKHTGAAAGTVSGDYITFDQYYGMPQNSKSAAYTFILSDAGKHIYHPSSDTTARIWTIPANASVPFLIGTTISLINDTGAGNITLAIGGTDILSKGGTGSTGSCTLLADGMATVTKVTATRWKISGINIS